jgi:hypothetical protein
VRADHGKRVGNAADGLLDGGEYFSRFAGSGVGLDRGKAWHGEFLCAMAVGDGMTGIW